MTNSVGTKRNKKRINKKHLIFYIALIALPLLQYIIFYIVVNINTFVLAFQNYDGFTDKVTPAGLDNIKKAFSDLFTDPEFRIMFRNSTICFLYTLFFGIPFSLLVSYYMFKKWKFHGMFRVILYLPQIVSNVALVTMFRVFVDYGVPMIWKAMTGNVIQGLYTNNETAFGTMLFFSIWFGVGSQILMYSSSMGGINDSLIEASEIDGANYWQQFWHVVLPSILSTISTFVIVTFAGFFTNQMSLFSFGGQNVSTRFYTFGYYLYMKLQTNATNKTLWQYLASLSITFTLFMVPIVFFLRFLMKKFGPSED